MNLTQLRYFQCVCKFESVTRAAEYLHISQPSISNALKELEYEFNITLFKRQYRGMIPTTEGHFLLEMTEQLLAHFEQVRTTMIDISKNQHTLSLGIPPMIGSLIMPELYDGFHAANPHIQFNVIEGGRQELLSLLNEHRLDIVFLPHEKPFASIYHTLYFSSWETVCCTSRQHPLSNRKRLRLSELSDQPLVLFKNSFFQTERILSIFESMNIKPNILLQIDQLATVHRFISRGLATGFLFRPLAESYSDLTIISLDPELQMDISLVWLNNSTSEADIRTFVNYISSMRLNSKFSSFHT